MFRRHPILAVVTFAYLGVVAFITLLPQPPQPAANSVFRMALAFFANYPESRWLTYQRLEFSANVLMFVPIGLFFLLLFGRKWWFVSVLAGVALTVTIEFVQRYIPGRVSDVSDIIANSTGTFVGVAVALIVTTPAALRLRRQRA